MKLTEPAKEVISEVLISYFLTCLENGYEGTKDMLMDELASYIPEKGVFANDQGYDEMMEYLTNHLTDQLDIQITIRN